VRPPRFRGVIFDLDGTLTRPTLDFAAMRREIGIPDGDLAEQIPQLPEGRRQEAWAIVEAHEERALREQELQDGALELLARCRDADIRTGVLTRNLARSVDHFCRQHGVQFDAVVTREFPFIKPRPEPVLHILEAWGMPPGDALMVGDYAHDVTCGRAAGVRTCFFQNPGRPDYGGDADYTVRSMAELDALLFTDRGQPHRSGSALKI
jgi:HAD superfamily hydrolase (TIGR01549 family)